MSMNFLGVFLGRFTMYRLMMYFLGIYAGSAVILALAGVSFFDPWSILFQTVLLIFLCWTVNEIAARIVRTTPNGESSVITALILSLIVGPLMVLEDWYIIAFIGIAAILSKYVIVWSRSHVFNPAAFGAVVSALILGQPASWWAGGTELVPILIAGGLVIASKVRRFHLIFVFLGVYGVLLAADLLWQGLGVLRVGQLLSAFLLSPSLLFFVFIMLIEPLTSPQTMPRRIHFGVCVGIALFLLQRFASGVPYSLELALLIGNLFARVIDPAMRQAFTLIKREDFSSAISLFWFEPPRPLRFLPGQFLEYTLSHQNVDSRGLRRYFTIASSPTEPQILITTRFAEKGSSFKRALRRAAPGNKIIASKVGGDFTLPQDDKQKLAFIAGGIGITPFRSMVKFLLDKNESRDIVLLYGARGESNLVFRDIFEEAKTKFGLKPVYALSDAAPPNWAGERRIIDAALIKKAVPDFLDRIFYVSGPEPMVMGLEKILMSMGVSTNRIKRDYFPGYD